MREFEGLKSIEHYEAIATELGWEIKFSKWHRQITLVTRKKRFSGSYDEFPELTLGFLFREAYCYHCPLCRFIKFMKTVRFHVLMFYYRLFC